jgi:hypothetical protein
MDSILVPLVIVDLDLIGMAMINATGRKTHMNNDIVATMPRARVKRATLNFFQTGRRTPVGELDAEAEKRGLILADPHTLTSFNAEHPEFADTFPNGTQWRVGSGDFCYVAFYISEDERRVNVFRRNDDWTGREWIAGFLM